MAVQMLGIKTKFTDDQGRPLIGGSVHTYYAGTSSPQDTFSDPELTVPNTNPVKLDDTGSANIFLKGTYRVRVFDVKGAFVEEQDNISRLATNERIDALTSEINSVKEKTLVVESIADLSTINNPKDGLRVYVKSYHAGLGKGGGYFTYDGSTAEINDSGVVINGWVRDDIHDLTAYDFGAVADGSYHALSEYFPSSTAAFTQYPLEKSLTESIDSAALAALSNYYFSGKDYQKGVSFGIIGSFVLTKTFLLALPRDMTVAQFDVDGNFFAHTDFFAGDSVVKFHGIIVNGFMRIDAKNKVDYCIIVSDMGLAGVPAYIPTGQVAPRLHLNNAKLFGIKMQDRNMFAEAPYIRGGGCGVTSAYAGVKQSSTVVSIDTVSPWDVGGYSLVKTASIPDDINRLPSNSKGFVVFRGNLHRIQEVSVDNKLKVMPHINISTNQLGVSEEIKFIYGGLVYTDGGDSAGIKFGIVSAVGCGSTITHNAMYTAVIDYLASEFSGITMVNNSLVGGLKVSDAYFEDDFKQYVNLNPSAQAFGGSTISHSTGLDVSKFETLAFNKPPSGIAIVGFSGLGGHTFSYSGVTHQKHPYKYSNNAMSKGYADSFAVSFNRPTECVSLYSDNAIIDFDEPVGKFNELFAYDYQEVSVSGTGNNSAPSSVTFKAPEGLTVNGKTSVVFQGFVSTAKFSCTYIVNAKDISIAPIQGVSKVRLSPSDGIPSDISSANDLPVDSFYTDTLSSTNPKISGLPQLNGYPAYVDVTISTAIKVGALDKANTLVQDFYIDKTKTKFRREKPSSVGAWLDWYVVEAPVLKGNTSSRPAEKPIGLQYFDTTLSANGKPIWWNGSAWVDADGVSV